MLVTEIGGWVDRFDRRGRLVFTTRTPTAYPSDAQLLPDGNMLVAGFDTPGRVDVITPAGGSSGRTGRRPAPGALDRPSLAVRWPNGMIAITDDWHHRIVVVDPRTKRIVWQYGHLGVPSAATGYLSKPDGLDLLPAATRPSSGATAAHRQSHRNTADARIASGRGRTSRRTGGRRRRARRRVVVAAGAARPAGATATRRDAARSPPTMRLSRSWAATHSSSAAARLASTDAVVQIDPRTGAARSFGSLGEPLSDLGAATVGGKAYLVGGYTGARYATAVLRFRPGHTPLVAARLPAGLRYAGVAALHGAIYVAGGVTPAGESDAVFAVDGGRVRLVATLPAPVAHASLATLGKSLYLVGGTDTEGRPLDWILRIDPFSGAVTAAGRLPSPLADAAAVTLGGRIIVLGGAGTTASAAVLALRPGTTAARAAGG